MNLIVISRISLKRLSASNQTFDSPFLINEFLKLKFLKPSGTFEFSPKAKG